MPFAQTNVGNVLSLSFSTVSRILGMRDFLGGILFTSSRMRFRRAFFLEQVSHSSARIFVLTKLLHRDHGESTLDIFSMNPRANSSFLPIVVQV